MAMTNIMQNQMMPISLSLREIWEPSFERVGVYTPTYHRWEHHSVCEDFRQKGRISEIQGTCHKVSATGGWRIFDFAKNNVQSRYKKGQNNSMADCVGTNLFRGPFQWKVQAAMKNHL